MWICDNCPYCYKPIYEDNYYECRVFGEDVPEEYETEYGCNCSDELLAELLEKNEQAYLKDLEDFCKWYEEKKQ